MGQGGKGHKNLVMTGSKIGRKYDLLIEKSVQLPLIKRPQMVRRGMNQNTQIVTQYRPQRELFDVPKMRLLSL